MVRDALQGTASTLTRAEVRGGGKKPYAQKGTGNARIGSRRTPLRPGGGVSFGPKVCHILAVLMCINSVPAFSSIRLYSIAEYDCSVQPVDWSIKMNKKERRLAVATALQSAAADVMVAGKIAVRFLPFLICSC